LREPDPDHDHRNRRLAHERAQDQAFHEQPEHDCDPDGAGDGQRPVQPRVDRQRPDDVRADQQELALREVDHARGLVDQHEAEGGEGEDRAVREARDGELDEGVHQAPLPISSCNRRRGRARGRPSTEATRSVI
jgi:hypothetical protein